LSQSVLEPKARAIQHLMNSGRQYDCDRHLIFLREPREVAEQAAQISEQRLVNSIVKCLFTEIRVSPMLTRSNPCTHRESAVLHRPACPMILRQAGTGSDCPASGHLDRIERLFAQTQQVNWEHNDEDPLGPHTVLK